MARQRVSNEQILAYLRRNAGVRFDATSVAEAFGVSHRTMWGTLDTLSRAGSIRREEPVNGKAGAWFIPAPSDAASKQPAKPYRMREWTPDPEFLRRAEEAQEHRRQFPSKHI